MKAPLTISIAEASELTGLSKYALRKAIASGDLPRFGNGRNVRIPRLPLLRMLGIENADAAIANGTTSNLVDGEEPRR